jgi:hypothetical protein
LGYAGVYIVSVVNLRTGRITGQEYLPFVPARWEPLIAANPKQSVIYLGYLDSSRNFHILAIDPTTLHVILESNLGANGAYP